MFGGMSLEDLEAKVWIIIILVATIVLTGIVVFTKPYIDKLFKPSDQNTESSQKIDEALKTLFSHFEDLKKNICN